jgi:hypothetical protein
MATLTNPKLLRSQSMSGWCEPMIFEGAFEGAIEDSEPPDWHREVLQERLDQAERSPEAAIRWEDIRAELVRKYKLRGFD